jgi:hypothetical protein
MNSVSTISGSKLCKTNSSAYTIVLILLTEEWDEHLLNEFSYRCVDVYEETRII